MQNTALNFRSYIFSHPYKIVGKTDHILDHKTSLSKCQRNRVTFLVSRIKLDSNGKKITRTSLDI